jgi:Leucine-rich repeat (LRR) protein
VKILHTDCKLQSLSLKSCDLNNSFFSDLCERLQKNENLTELDLYDNQITNLVPLASVLQVNRTLKSLSLCKNSIRDQDLAPLVGVFGKIRMSALEAEEYKKIEREKATSKYLAGNQNLSKSFTDDLEFNEDSGEYFLIKNKVFRNFNLSLNCCDADHFLRLVLSQVLPSFKILISKNPLPETVKNSLMQAFSGNVIV